MPVKHSEVSSACVSFVNTPQAVIDSERQAYVADGVCPCCVCSRNIQKLRFRACDATFGKICDTSELHITRLSWLRLADVCDGCCKPYDV